MKLFIPKDIFDNPKPPRLFLCTPDKKKIGELSSYDETLDGKWGSYSEMNFSIDRQYVDVLTGELKTNPLFDKVEGLRKVYVEGFGYFIIQDPSTTYGDKDSKTISCFSGEYETGSKYLENFRINTGEIDSKEVIALESEYGYNYTIDKDNLYKLASGEYDPYKNYYIMEHTDNDSYIYQQTTVEKNEYAEYINKNNSTDFQPHEKLYVKSYPNVQFYSKTRPELSLLHLIFEKIPGWEIGNVDVDLGRKERTFDEDRIAVYDFLMNEIQDTFKCVVEWDIDAYTVNFYEEEENGITEDDEIQSRWETDVFVSRDNLANEININYSTDDIKTKLKVSGSDNLDIREINLGQNYIMNLDYYHTPEWMEQDLFEAYDHYLEAVESYTKPYTTEMQNWVGANNKYNEFMNAVPAEGNVVLVGDLFKKLYCIYGLYNYTNKFIENTTYYIMSDDGNMSEANPQPNSENFKNGIYYVKGDFDTKKGELIKQLTLYHVNEDVNANNPDNYLLRLSNSNSDVVTIRIYNASEDEDKKANPNYKIQVITVYAQSGMESAAKTYSMDEWVKGELTAKYMGLEDYKVTYIGIMGAYFVLAKDEAQEENLEEYGVNLLKEKHKTYTSIFQTQTEAMFSQEKYQCIVQDEQPEGDYDIGTRWLDTNSSPAKLYQYSDIIDENNGEVIGKEWKIISEKTSETDQMNYENYQRYIDNYEKMVAVQNVLVRKEKQATYMGDGYSVVDTIKTNSYTKDDMARIARYHFIGYWITPDSVNQDVPIYYFTTTYDPNNKFAVYLKGTTPYVAYANSRGVYQAIMDYITKQIDLENFFAEDQWIRLSPFIREDEFSDSNFLLTGYESEEERLEICKELLKTASKELKTLSQPSLEFSMNMANILALPEFSSLFDQFQLGNFIRVHLYDHYVKRARLLEVHLNFSDLSGFSCNFGNLVTTKSEIDKHADLLAQAVSAGKQVAASAGNWQKAVDKSNKLEQDIANGLTDVTLEIGKANGQSIELGQNGLIGRKLIDGTTDQYENEQVALMNNKLVFTADGWKTSKAAFGKFSVKDKNGNETTHWGMLSDAIISGYIEGTTIKGGRLEIGGEDGTFIVNENGGVEIKVGGEDKYAGQAALNEVKNAYRYTVELSYNGSTVFSSKSENTIMTAIVKDLNVDITHRLPIGTEFVWHRNGVKYKTFTITNDNKPKKGVVNKEVDKLTANQINITHADIEGNSFFSCQVNFADAEIQKGE